MVVWNLIKRFGGWLAAAFVGMMLLRSVRNTAKAKAEKAATEDRMRRTERTAVGEIQAARTRETSQVATSKEAGDVQASTNRLDAGAAADELRKSWSRD